MKILFDTCVWSLSLRRKTKTALSGSEQQMLESFTSAIEDGRVAMIGPIRQEILSGIQHADQFERLRGALEAFPDEPITTSHYEEAARLDNLCRSRGVQCGPVDMLICAVAGLNHWAIVTMDGGLERCIAVLKAEGAMR